MGERYEETECMRYAWSMAQLADARLMALEEGNGRGDRVIAFRNGSGLAFTVSPDRGMDLVDCSFGGIPLVFRSQTGYSAGARHEASGKGWLRNWQGGLMTTAGLRNVGAANGEFGLHGRISNLAAEDVGIRRGWEGGRYRLEASGTLRECAMFGEHLELCRTISTGLGENVIRLHDRVTNRSCREDYLQILYHCNLGYPFASPELVFDVEAHEVIPRDAEAAAGLAGWDRLDEPRADYREQCFYHRLPAGPDGMAGIAVENPALGIRLRIEYSAGTLPNFVQWKNCLSGGYALGLEPTNASVLGRAADIGNGTARKIQPGESVEFDLIFRFEHRLPVRP